MDTGRLHHIKQVVAAKSTDLPEDELSLGEHLMLFISDLTEGAVPFTCLSQSLHFTCFAYNVQPDEELWSSM
jgi:hypothetical protein